MPEEALTSFTVFDAYSYICASYIVIEVKSRSRIEYIIPTYYIIVLDYYVNLTNKSNLVDRL